MAVYGQQNLFDMRGQVRIAKPNASKESIDNAINRRIRKLYDRHWWSDSLRIGTIAIPQAYQTGTVSLTQGSSIVTGSGTAWPINDLVNTTIPLAINDLGYQKVTPASMANIKVGTYLLIDAPTPASTEIVIVVELANNGNAFIANFSKTHLAAAPIYSSSLAGKQFKAQFPIFTVQAVLTATSLQIDNLWGGLPNTGLAYWIAYEYAQITPLTRRLMFAYDPNASEAIDIWTTQEDLSIIDPQRTESDNPKKLAQMPVSAAGVAQWEIWPAQLSPYVLSVVTQENWPLLKNDTDRSPWFMNPDVIISGAIADVMRIKAIKTMRDQDPYYDPQVARVYDGQFEEGYEELRQADEGRAATLLSSYVKQIGGDYNYARAHAVYQDGDYGIWA